MRCSIFFILKLELTHDFVLVCASKVLGLSEYLSFGIELRSFSYFLKCIPIVYMPFIQIDRGCDAHHTYHRGDNRIHYGHIVSLLRLYGWRNLGLLSLKIDVLWNFLWCLICIIFSYVHSRICLASLIGSLIIWLRNARRGLILLCLVCRNRCIRSIHWQGLIHSRVCNIRRRSLILLCLILCLGLI